MTIYLLNINFLINYNVINILWILVLHFVDISYGKMLFFQQVPHQKARCIFSHYSYLDTSNFFSSQSLGTLCIIQNICIRGMRGRRCIERYQLSYIYWVAAPQLPPSPFSLDFSHEFVRRLTKIVKREATYSYLTLIIFLNHIINEVIM